jgi:glyoxylase-like metal-dependent hydrolase (beta-lactamase superfamily II)
VCYLVLPGRRLFTGDLVLGEGSSAILHPDGSVADCLASLARLVALRPALLLPGHGPPVEEAVRRLEAYRRHRLEREAEVRRALSEGATTVPEIRDAVYGELPPGLRWAADASVAAHLAALADRGEKVPAYDRFGAVEDDHA